MGKTQKITVSGVGIELSDDVAKALWVVAEGEGLLCCDNKIEGILEVMIGEGSIFYECMETFLILMSHYTSCEEGITRKNIMETAALLCSQGKWWNLLCGADA